MIIFNYSGVAIKSVHIQNKSPNTGRRGNNGETSKRFWKKKKQYSGKSFVVSILLFVRHIHWKKTSLKKKKSREDCSISRTGRWGRMTNNYWVTELRYFWISSIHFCRQLTEGKWFGSDTSSGESHYEIYHLVGTVTRVITQIMSW